MGALSKSEQLWLIFVTDVYTAHFPNRYLYDN